MFLRKSHGQYFDRVWQIFVINLVYLHSWSLIELKQFKGVAVVMGVEIQGCQDPMPPFLHPCQ